MCDEFHPYRLISFHVIRYNRHGNKYHFFASFFNGTRERKDLQQPEPQRSVSALTAQHCYLLCPVISCLIGHVESPLVTFSVELLQMPEPLQGQRVHLLRQCIPWAVVQRAGEVWWAFILFEKVRHWQSPPHPPLKTSLPGADEPGFNVFGVKKHVSVSLKDIPALVISFMRLQCY